MSHDHDLHLWLDADEYAWLCRQAREQDRSKNAILRRLIRQARAESMDDDEDFTMDNLGLGRPRSGR